YELRDPHEHLQFKHEWLRAALHEREEIRQQNGTTFVEFDRIPGFYSFDNCPIDAMHLFDHGVTPALIRDIIYKPGMLRKRFHRQPVDETPEARFDAFVQRTYFPSHCSRLPPKIEKMGGRMKAEQWRTLRVILPAAFFEAWRVGDAIPENDMPRDPDQVPELEDCASSRNPRDYYANILHFCVACNGLFRHRVKQQVIEVMSALLELIGITFARMNVHMTPSFHCATHIGDHILKYGNVYGTWMYDFERANRVLINVNTNAHGHGVLEATMAKGFMRRAECYRYVRV
ncbi:hypothetical protein BDV93DRAFT_459249, partial [Ceratobasidium sp. AG-I]